MMKILDLLQQESSNVLENIIVSDANTVYIDYILETSNANQYFSRIFTNQAEWENGQLRVSPYHNNDFCNMCPDNMCKGQIYEEIFNDFNNISQIIYIGDGRGDFCPSQKLRSCDYVFARKNYPLEKLIAESDIEAEMVSWIDGIDLLSKFKEVLMK
eukprot:TRINITY_DN776_c0_g3_i2.p1 TRINITY_DN776_c0_g3~~TRINITY_DN776_c0_g3_i2.p1  ORF type:complete len:157 (-),score=36.47 TRINITY_DN776_c0_g3_i2:9-479(-)